MARTFEFECRSCGDKTSQSKRDTPEVECSCGESKWRRVWDFGLVWPLDQRGH